MRERVQRVSVRAVKVKMRQFALAERQYHCRVPTVIVGTASRLT